MSAIANIRSSTLPVPYSSDTGRNSWKNLSILEALDGYKSCGFIPTDIAKRKLEWIDNYYDLKPEVHIAKRTIHTSGNDPDIPCLDKILQILDDINLVGGVSLQDERSLKSALCKEKHLWKALDELYKRLLDISVDHSSSVTDYPGKSDLTNLHKYCVSLNQAIRIRIDFPSRAEWDCVLTGDLNRRVIEHGAPQLTRRSYIFDKVDGLATHGKLELFELGNTAERIELLQKCCDSARQALAHIVKAVDSTKDQEVIEVDNIYGQLETLPKTGTKKDAFERVENFNKVYIELTLGRHTTALKGVLTIDSNVLEILHTVNELGALTFNNFSPIGAVGLRLDVIKDVTNKIFDVVKSIST